MNPPPVSVSSQVPVVPVRRALREQEGGAILETVDVQDPEPPGPESVAVKGVSDEEEQVAVLLHVFPEADQLLNGVGVNVGVPEVSP